VHDFLRLRVDYFRNLRYPLQDAANNPAPVSRNILTLNKTTEESEK
jgi:hypothetical protein